MLYQLENPHGGDIYAEPITLDYSANINPFGTPPGVLEAIRQALPQVWHYPDPYCRALTGAIAEYEQMPRDYILCGNGAAELIYSFGQTVRPSLAVELAPTFSEYAFGLETVGTQILRYDLKEENDFILDKGFLSFLEEKKPEAVFLCSPNNPTGQMIPPELLQRIVRTCQSMGTRLFLDECFLDMTDSGQSMKVLLAECPKLIILKAFTKSYGMAGIRLGYCLSADPELLQSMARMIQPWNVSSLAQAAGVAALKETSFLEQAKAVIRDERLWLTEALEKLGFKVCPSQVNFILFNGKPGLDKALRKKGIAIRSCENYYGLCQGWYRIAVRCHDENLQLMEAIRDEV